MGCKDLYYVKTGDTIRSSDFLTKRQALKEIILRAGNLYEWEGLDTSVLDQVEGKLDSYSISETVMPDDHNIIRESLSELLVELGKIHDPDKLQELLTYLNDHVRTVKIGDIIKPDDHNDLVKIIEALCKLPSIRTGGLLSEPRYGLTQGIGAVAQYYPRQGYKGRFLTLTQYFEYWERDLSKPDEDPFRFFSLSEWDKEYGKIYVAYLGCQVLDETIEHEKNVEYGWYGADDSWNLVSGNGSLASSPNRIYLNFYYAGDGYNYMIELEKGSYALVNQKRYLVSTGPETPETRHYVPTNVGYFHSIYDGIYGEWASDYGNLGVRHDSIMECYYLRDEDVGEIICKQAILVGSGIYPRDEVLLFSASQNILQRVSADLSAVLSAYKFNKNLIKYDFTGDGRLILAFEGRHIVVTDLELSYFEKYRIDIPFNDPSETEILDVRSCSDEIMILLHRGDWHIFVITDLDLNIKDVFGTLFFKWCYGYGEGSYNTPCQDYPEHWPDREFRSAYMRRDPITKDIIGYTIVYFVPRNTNVPSVEDQWFYIQTSKNGYFGDCFASHHQIAEIISNPSEISYSPVEVSIHYVKDTDIYDINYEVRDGSLASVKKECC